jgi:hypothetical protein
MIYGGPGFFCGRIIRLHPTLFLLFHQQVASLSKTSCVSPFEHIDGRGGEGLSVGPNQATQA